MNQEQIILKQGSELVAMLRGGSQVARAKDIESIIEDRFIWDRMVARLISKLTELLTVADLPEEQRSLTGELIEQLQSQQPDAHQERVYLPAKKLAKEVGERG